MSSRDPLLSAGARLYTPMHVPLQESRFRRRSHVTQLARRRRLALGPPHLTLLAFWSVQNCTDESRVSINHYAGLRIAYSGVWLARELIKIASVRGCPGRPARKMRLRQAPPAANCSLHALASLPQGGLVTSLSRAPVGTNRKTSPRSSPPAQRRSKDLLGKARITRAKQQSFSGGQEWL